MQICTIGYQRKQLDDFFQTLQNQQISLLLDVRSYVTCGHPHFRAPVLEKAASHLGMTYAWAKELGGKPRDKRLYTDGKPDYEKMAGTAQFKRGIQLLTQDLNHGRNVALMCMEADHNECHRSILITNYLQAHMNIRVNHLS